jgi:hypothetical protein
MSKYVNFPYLWNKLSVVALAGGLMMLIFLGACTPGTNEIEPLTPTMEPAASVDSASVPDPAQTPTEAAPDTPEVIRPSTTEEGQVTEEIPQSILDAVLGDAQKRSNSSSENITVQQVEFMNWNDGSLGCPRPNREYNQEITPGYRVELQAQDTSYVYHTNTEKTIILCFQDGLPVIPIDPKEKIQDGEPWVPVD